MYRYNVVDRHTPRIVIPANRIYKYCGKTFRAKIVYSTTISLRVRMQVIYAECCTCITY